MTYVRLAFVYCYALLTVLAFCEPAVPGVMWTMVMPAVPFAVTIIGFTWWRSVCPLAAAGALGAHFSRAQGPRAPALLRSFPLSAALVLLGVALTIRLVAINGSGPALGAILLLIALAAFFVNLSWGGRSFCNHLCPVGVVERIYTDGAPLLAARAGRCRPCTGCKARCPDAQQERAFENDLESADRRWASYAFPGLVWGFYAYYFLREGEWAAFFDGRWTSLSFGGKSLFGPGFYFLPQLPAVIAAPLTLVAACAVGYGAFCAVEQLLGRHQPDARLVRRRCLALAAFCAFNSFYLFAGAPTLLLFPCAARLTAFVVPVVATIVLLRRWKHDAVSPARIKLPVIAQGGQPCI